MPKTTKRTYKKYGHMIEVERIEGYLNHVVVIRTFFGDVIHMQLAGAMGERRWCPLWVTDTADPATYPMSVGKIRARAGAWKIAEGEMARLLKIPFPY